jgi:pyruvate formate lyase activating enzyme
MQSKLLKLKEGMFYEKKDGKTVQCHLCPRNCVIPEGKRGNCRVRENKGGKLYSLAYAELCAVAIDPIEKKPFFHFLPGHTAYSVGTAGCNLHCKFCQNWTTSQANPEDVSTERIMPEELVKQAIDAGCRTIAYTYNEPIIYYEYVYDTARIAKKKGLRNLMVSNGFINEKPMQKLAPYIDAINVDLKGFTEEFYRDVTESRLQPVLDSLIFIKKKTKIWLEITNLIIPTLNDDMKTIEEMCKWIKKSLGPDVPLHFSAFYPCYKMMNLPHTPPETLEKAKEIAEKVGLHYVYVGNVVTKDGENTYCPKCKELVIERRWFDVLQNRLKNGKCINKHKIAGVWK